MRTLLKEQGKRHKTIIRNRINDINWKLKKYQIVKEFEQVDQLMSLHHGRFMVFSGPNEIVADRTTEGKDLVQLTHPSRNTGIFYTKKDPTNPQFREVDNIKEYGASLLVSRIKNANIDIILIPCVHEEQVRDKDSIIIFSTKDPLKITEKVIKKAIKTYLIFQRVDSIYEDSSKLERLKISLLSFFDIRRYGEKNNIFFQLGNTWGVGTFTVATAICIALATQQ